MEGEPTLVLNLNERRLGFLFFFIIVISEHFFSACSAEKEKLSFLPIVEGGRGQAKGLRGLHSRDSSGQNEDVSV